MHTHAHASSTRERRERSGRSTDAALDSCCVGKNSSRHGTPRNFEWRRTDGGGIDAPSGEVGAEALLRGMPVCECTEGPVGGVMSGPAVEAGVLVSDCAVAVENDESEAYPSA